MAKIRKKFSPQYQHGCPHENVDKSLELVRIDFLADGSDGADRGIVALQLFFDLLHAVHDGGMVPAAHDVADLFQSGVIFLAEVHGNLTGISDIGGAFVAVDIGGRNMEMLRYDLDNQLRSYLAAFSRRNDIFDRFFRKKHINGPFFQGGKGDPACD